MDKVLFPEVLDQLFHNARTNFLFNLGYGDPSQLSPRDPRLEFNEATLIL